MTNHFMRGVRNFGERLAVPSGWPLHHSSESGLTDPGIPSPIPPVARDIQSERDQKHGGCREREDGVDDLSDAEERNRADARF